MYDLILKGGCCVAMKMIEVDDGNGNKAEIHRYGAATEEDILFKDFPCGETVICLALIFNLFLNGILNSNKE